MVTTSLANSSNMTTQTWTSRSDSARLFVERFIQKRRRQPALARWLSWLGLILTALLFPVSLAAQETSSVAGIVVDAVSEEPVEGVFVVVAGQGSLFGRTDEQGVYRIDGVPVGEIELIFTRSGYLNSRLTEIEVVAGEVARASFPLPPREETADETTGDIVELEEFQVTQEEVEEVVINIERRFEADRLVDIFSAEDLARFAEGDVAGAIKRIPGVSVVEGQFAIIRGLEDRYNTTLFNGAPVPSPDPDRQSVQLDLFPSEIVSRLEVSKTFGEELPSNSAGGTLDIITAAYPEVGTFTVKFGTGLGFNENANDTFIQARPGNALGAVGEDESPRWETDASVFVGASTLIGDRNVRFIGTFATEKDYETEIGWEQSRETNSLTFFDTGTDFGSNFVRRQTLDTDNTTVPLSRTYLVDAPPLSLGLVPWEGDLWEYTDSEYTEKESLFLGFGFDLDKEGNHAIDFSYFLSKVYQESVDYRTGQAPDQLVESTSFPGTFLPADQVPLAQPVGFPEDAIPYQQNTLQRGLASDTYSDSPYPYVGDSFIYRLLIEQGAGSGVDFTDAGDFERAAPLDSNFFQSATFLRDRELEIRQVRGEHRIDSGLGFTTVRWHLTRGETSQTESVRRFSFWEAPINSSVPGVERLFRTRGDDTDLGGVRPFLATEADVKEVSDVGFIELEHEIEINENLLLTFSAGVLAEIADREAVSGTADFGTNSPALAASSPEALESAFFANPNANFQEAEFTAKSSRDIDAVFLGAKVSVPGRFEAFAGFRFEDLQITTENFPFTELPPGSPNSLLLPSGETVFGAGGGASDPFGYTNLGIPGGAPSLYTFLLPGYDIFTQSLDPSLIGPDGRFRDPDRDPAARLGLSEEVNGILITGDPLDTTADILRLLNRSTERELILPTLGMSYRPNPNLQFRANFSKTVGRPSLREIGYYLSPVRGSRDLVVGNPLLETSDVRSYDFRAEYVFGDSGDLVAVSIFRKHIDNPIEKIVVSEPTQPDPLPIQTFFNNPGAGIVTGFEFEARTNLEITGIPGAEFFSIGGNFTYIDAKVPNTPAAIAEAEEFLGFEEGIRGSGFSRRNTTYEYAQDRVLTEYPTERRLFNQPEWIGNLDLTFDQPDWGTTATIAYFTISDVLTTVGGTTLRPAGLNPARSLVWRPDLYADSFYQLDLIFSQKIGAWTFRLNVRNLTDTIRRTVYDPEIINPENQVESEYRVGRDYSLSASVTF